MASKVIMKKGGSNRMIIENFKDGDHFKVSRDNMIDKITVKKSGTTAGNIKMGTYVSPRKEVQVYTVTAEPTASGNLSVVLNGAGAVLIAILDADTTAGVATKIGAGTYTGWTTIVSGSTVTFVSDDFGAKAGAYTVSGVAGVAGSWVEKVAGVTEAIGEQTVATVALSAVDGNMSELTLAKKYYEADTEVYVDVSTAATGTLVITTQKLF